MATSTWQAFGGLRDEKVDAFPGSTGPATAIYHGAFACVNSSGFVEDYTSTSRPLVIGIVRKVAGDANSTGDVITTQGSINGGNNLVELITEAKVDGIPFNSDLTAKDIGKSVYAIDNFTVTCNPAASTNMSRVGTLTKYYTSAKGEFKLEGYPVNGLMEKATVLTTSSSSVMMAIVNPLGLDVILEKFQLAVTTASSSAHAVSAGIGATSTAIATDVVNAGGATLGSSGIYGTAKTTNFFGNVMWGATKYLTLSSSSAVGDGGDVGTLVGWIKYSYKTLA